MGRGLRRGLALSSARRARGCGGAAPAQAAGGTRCSRSSRSAGRTGLPGRERGHRACRAPRASFPGRGCGPAGVRAGGAEWGDPPASPGVWVPDTGAPHTARLGLGCLWSLLVRWGLRGSPGLLFTVVTFEQFSLLNDPEWFFLCYKPS